MTWPRPWRATTQPAESPGPRRAMTPDRRSSMTVRGAHERQGCRPRGRARRRRHARPDECRHARPERPERPSSWAPPRGWSPVRRGGPARRPRIVRRAPALGSPGHVPDAASMTWRCGAGTAAESGADGSAGALATVNTGITRSGAARAGRAASSLMRRPLAELSVIHRSPHGAHKGSLPLFASACLRRIKCEQ